MIERINDTTKRAAAVGFVSLMLISGATAYSEWADRRDHKKAEVAEFMRRNSLTPDQRIAEDSAKSNRAAQEKAERDRVALVASNESAKASFKRACQEALMQTLYDPAAAQITSSHGTMIDGGKYEGWIEGRAKNAFGAYIIGAWSCEAHSSRSDIVVTKVFQYKP